MLWECSECGGQVERERAPIYCEECGTAGVIFVEAEPYPELGDPNSGRELWLAAGFEQVVPRLAA
jgi:hypothetical protein